MNGSGSSPPVYVPFGVGRHDAAPPAIIIVDPCLARQTAVATAPASADGPRLHGPRLTDMTWLITGGAGYIGAHVVRAMTGAGERVVVLDDLSTGIPDRLPADVPLIRGSAADRTLLDRVLAENAVTGVVHLAAKKQVGESVEKPLLYYLENVSGLAVLLEAVVAAGVQRFVFSSSAAYGVPDAELITEETPAPRSIRTVRRSSPGSGWSGRPGRRTPCPPAVCATSMWREQPNRNCRTPVSSMSFRCSSTG